MGKIIGTVFGGGRSKSKNKAYQPLLSNLLPNLSQGNSAMSTLGGLLGLGDQGTRDAAGGTLSNFLDSTGFKHILDTGSRAITNNAASRGLLNSGATGKALIDYGQQAGSTFLDSLMEKLGALGQYGINSANAISGAGQVNKSVDYGKGIFNSLFPGGISPVPKGG